MIAIVKNNFDNTWVTKDKKLCYIGFETGYKPNYQYHYTSYFEKWLINKNCDPKKTLIENRIADISYHFESACIAGPWTLDAAYDGILKSKYKNLCALCGSPSGCYEGDRFYGMQGAISCLLENVGEIAWLSRSIAVPYFAEMSSYGFSLLCPDGMFIPLSVNKTCTWITEPRPTIVARSEVADRVLKSITDMERSGKAFYSIVHASYKFSHLKNVVPALIPEEYMRSFQGYLSSKVHSYCPPDRTVRWCVSSNIEASKCGWIQAAALAVDIQPKISCIQQKDKKSAIQAIVDDRCDVYIAKPEEELNARSMNLTPIAHLISNKDLEANRFAAIVKKDAKFKNLNDLKGSNACFTGYKSVGWNSFFTILRNSSSRWDCSDAKAMSQFFNRSCVYGLSEMNTTIPKNLYSLCNSSFIDKSLGPEENTFKCLMNGGDVAFVNVSAAKKYYSDETNKSEEPCFLVETTLGSILASKNITQVRREEIYLLFLSLDRFFGNIYDRETAMFTLYGPYEGHSDIIFPDKTQHLQKHVDDRRRGQTYEEILENLQDKVICGLSSNSSLKSSISFLTFMIFHAIWTLSA
ncbi:PREDICTED: transferrin isoform X1 [Ceratosolen solmsi marchali]|uniref:Transferrin isoform X1 n=1 Tax=Ceratosolen solmsi marchali TaxID=326594 RepID=A0AAJ6YVL9_9HYME|nr:PREDICTED: transferrin isoform X1 [Ceratosolen solmsi marchali]